MRSHPLLFPQYQCFRSSFFFGRGANKKGKKIGYTVYCHIVFTRIVAAWDFSPFASVYNFRRNNSVPSFNFVVWLVEDESACSCGRLFFTYAPVCTPYDIKAVTLNFLPLFSFLRLKHRKKIQKSMKIQKAIKL